MSMKKPVCEPSGKRLQKTMEHHLMLVNRLSKLLFSIANCWIAKISAIPGPVCALHGSQQRSLALESPKVRKSGQGTWFCRRWLGIPRTKWWGKLGKLCFWSWECRTDFLGFKELCTKSWMQRPNSSNFRTDIGSEIQNKVYYEGQSPGYSSMLNVPPPSRASGDQEVTLCVWCPCLSWKSISDITSVRMQWQLVNMPFASMSWFSLMLNYHQSPLFAIFLMVNITMFHVNC